MPSAGGFGTLGSDAQAARSRLAIAGRYGTNSTAAAATTASTRIGSSRNVDIVHLHAI